jgi:hypothetical protein
MRVGCEIVTLARLASVRSLRLDAREPLMPFQLPSAIEPSFRHTKGNRESQNRPPISKLSLWECRSEFSALTA